MMDEKKVALAKQVYNDLCRAIENREWKYDKDEENLAVYFGVSGEDFPMQFVLNVDVERQLLRVMSPLPFKFGEDNRIEGAIATCVASNNMLDGSFDYNLNDGAIIFRMTASFRDSVIGEGLFQYMISASCAAVDYYNDQFVAINVGILSIDDFIKSES